MDDCNLIIQNLQFDNDELTREFKFFNLLSKSNEYKNKNQKLID